MAMLNNQRVNHIKSDINPPFDGQIHGIFAPEIAARFDLPHEPIDKATDGPVSYAESPSWFNTYRTNYYTTWKNGLR